MSSRLRVATRDASRGFVGMSAAEVFASEFSVEVDGMLASMPSIKAQPAFKRSAQRRRPHSSALGCQ